MLDPNNQLIAAGKFEVYMGRVLYYLAIKADARSTYLRRRYGAIIVSKENRIISTGYNADDSLACGKACIVYKRV